MTTLIPSTEQREVLDLGLTSVRIRAGAGTGKTTTVAMVIENLVTNHGLEPARVLGITFTNKAAAELVEKVRSMFPSSPDPGRQPEIHTYHGFAAQVLAEFGMLIGIDGPIRVMTPTFSRQLLDDILRYRDFTHLDATYRGTLDRIRRLGDRVGDHLLDPASLLSEKPPSGESIAAQRREMAEALALYELEKRRLGVVDYADLVTLSTRVLRDHPELAETIRRRYQVVVLDEYQDTNPAQRMLLTTIFGEGFPVIAVGDEDQTIYEWRGASSRNFELFGTHFPRADGSPALEVSLRLNRRSTPEILAIANDVRAEANPDADPLDTATPDESGEVITFWARDALEEADWIARRFELLRESGVPWSEMAVLLRRNSDFAVIIEAMGHHDIPIEVANVGGLLSVPEVAELRAWLTALERPEDSTALTQLLLGSRFRLGLADLAPLTRLVATADQRDADEVVPLSLVEGLERIDESTGLRPEAREAYDRFLSIYRQLLLESQGVSLVETCRLILGHIRAWQDVESLPPSRRVSTRLNIHRFLDLAESWSPLTGRASTRAFLDYLELMAEEPAEELDAARLSGEDAVTLVTIHRAKGLEWEVVALPAMVKNRFPGSAVQYPDPVRFAHELPPALRIDDVLDDMPEDEEERSRFFRERHRIQEWRVAYVAVTRAKRVLLASGAAWYGRPEPSKTPRRPSPLFELMAGHPVSRSDGHREAGERPELLYSRDDTPNPDPLFERGWTEALRRARDHPEELDAIADNLGVEDRYDQIIDELQERLFQLAEPDPGHDALEPVSVSVTGLVTYASCPRRFYWSEIDPLPRRHNPAAVRGTELHRRIELHQRGQLPLEEIDHIVYDVVEGEGKDGTGGGYRAYLESRFAARSADLVEARFDLGLANGALVRGRIDAIYREGGRWEVVDFKSGRSDDDPSRIVQLQAYGLAARDVDLGLPPPRELRLSFVYLGGGLEVETIDADPDWLRRAEENIVSLTEDIDQERFEPVPGRWCRGCDFLRFCESGQSHVAAAEG